MSKGTIERLKVLQKSFAKKHEFSVGDIVTWKEGLKNKLSKGPFVVMKVLPESVLDGSRDAGSTYFREPLDIILAFVDGDGDFMMYHNDSRRIEPA